MDCGYGIFDVKNDGRMLSCFGFSHSAIPFFLSPFCFFKILGKDGVSIEVWVCEELVYDANIFLSKMNHSFLLLLALGWLKPPFALFSFCLLNLQRFRKCGKLSV